MNNRQKASDYADEKMKDEEPNGFADVIKWNKFFWEELDRLEKENK